MSKPVNRNRFKLEAILMLAVPAVVFLVGFLAIVFIDR